MSSVVRGNIKTAIASVQAAKWRSFLTMMGVIIGIVSVVTVVSIGEGVKQQVVSQINQRGKDLITVRPGQVVNRDEKGAITGVNIFSGYTSLGSLRDTDLSVVRNTKGVKRAVPLSMVAGPIEFEKKQHRSAFVVGTTPDLPLVLRQSVEYGGFFTEDDSNQNGAVIGKQVARDIFGEDIPLGQSFTFQDQSFIVRGIFKPFPSAPLSLDTDYNNVIFIPYEVSRSITDNKSDIYELLIEPSKEDTDGAIAAKIHANLKKAHGGQEDFTVLKQSESLQVTNNIVNLMTRLIGGIAAISLLVGGIGIMNVMLVSVTERMHEIGIRKAIGATSRQIMTQFMIEATVLSVLGGIIGILVSIVLSLIIRAVTNLEPIINWQVVVLAALVSLAVGIIFGTAPALKAARKDPIEALRNE